MFRYNISLSTPHALKSDSSLLRLLDIVFILVTTCIRDSIYGFVTTGLPF